MDPIDKYFDRNQNNVNALENDKEITRDKLKKWIVLQHHRVSVLKKAKFYWSSYLTSKEKRKRKQANEAAAAASVPLLNVPNGPNVMPPVGYTYPDDITTQIQHRNAVYGGTTSAYMYSTQQYDQLPGRAVAGPQSAPESTRGSNRLMDPSNVSVPRGVPPPMQPPTGLLANSMFSQFSSQIQPEYADTLRKWLLGFPPAQLPPAQLYLTGKIVSAVTSDIVANYYANVGLARSFELPIQRSLLYHLRPPLCGVCGSGASTVWYRDLAESDNSASCYKCHRCVSFLSDVSYVPLPMSTAISTSTSTTVDSGSNQGGAAKSVAGSSDQRLQPSRITTPRQIPPVKPIQTTRTTANDNDDDVIFVSSSSSSSFSKPIKHLPTNSSSSTNKSQPDDIHRSVSNVKSTVQTTAGTSQMPPTSLIVPKKSASVNNVNNLATQSAGMVVAGSSNSSKTDKVLSFVKTKPPNSSTSFPKVNKLIESTSDTIDVIDAKN